MNNIKDSRVRRPGGPKEQLVPGGGQFVASAGGGPAAALGVNKLPNIGERIMADY